MPHGLAVVLSLLVLLLVLIVAGVLLWLSGRIIVEGWQPYSEQFAYYQHQAQSWLRAHALDRHAAGRGAAHTTTLRRRRDGTLSILAVPPF